MTDEQLEIMEAFDREIKENLTCGTYMKWKVGKLTAARLEYLEGLQIMYGSDTLPPLGVKLERLAEAKDNSGKAAEECETCSQTRQRIWTKEGVDGKEVQRRLYRKKVAQGVHPAILKAYWNAWDLGEKLEEPAFDKYAKYSREYWKAKAAFYKAQAAELEARNV